MIKITCFNTYIVRLGCIYAYEVGNDIGEVQWEVPQLWQTGGQSCRVLEWW